MKNNLVIFVKYPESGKVKTRIGKIIGNDKASDIYSALVYHLVNDLIYPADYKVSIFFTPTNKEKLIKIWLSGISNKIDYFPQKGMCLGERISNSFDRSFSSGFENTIVIGSDCIELNHETIKIAFNYLNNYSDCIIGPAYDGGYYLVGLRAKNFPYIFEDISWSSESVFSKTMEKINYLNLKCIVLEKLNDVDNICDLDTNVIELVKKYKPEFNI